jgi:hypothetical protein
MSSPPPFRVGCGHHLDALRWPEVEVENLLFKKHCSKQRLKKAVDC